VPVGTITAEISSSIAQTNRSLVVDFQTMKMQVRESLLRERLMATLSGFFGGLAALLATIGLYGVMSYTVARRRNEIGIRMALGADRGDVVRMVLREAGALLAAGVVVGTVLAVAAARTASTLLFGLHAGDPATLAMAAGGLTAVARMLGVGFASSVALGPGSLAMFALFYVLGYLLYSSLYAALGAAFNTADEAQYWSFILTLPLLFGGMAAWSLFEQANSNVAVALSLVPPLAPVLMSMRIAVGAVTHSTPALDIGLDVES